MTSIHYTATFRELIRRIGRKLQGGTPVLLGVCTMIMLLAGCESSPKSSAMSGSTGPAAAHGETASTVTEPAKAPEQEAQARSDEESGKLSEIVTIREGDVLKISFPGAPPLDTTQQVRADGVVTLEILGEVKVAGQAPKELEKALSKRYESQLVSNVVVVTIISSSFDVYVTGAVLRPGKITTTKPITAFQAIMEAGYDPVNSDLAKVKLIRPVGREKYAYIPLNLQLVLEGKDTAPFYLKPADTLQVPKKFTVF